METRSDISREILNEFLDRWTLEKVQLMTLEEYVSVGDRDTFCQWIETRTKRLGSIKGISSIKFGIYKRSDPIKRPKTFRNDSLYSWQSYYGETRQEAFKKIKGEILEIIKFARNGQFEKIDKIHLTNFVKWKIAYLYSNERLIPIFKKEVLLKISNHFGVDTDSHTTLSAIYQIIISNKPSHLSIYEYAESLYVEFGGANYRDKGKLADNEKKRAGRKAATGRNTETQIRNGASSYIAIQKHNILQEALKEKLIAIHGAKNVLLEEDYVDVKLLLVDSINYYEVKSCAFASDCVKEALGQILSYIHYDKDKRKKKIIVVGQYPPNRNELEYLKFIKKNLRVQFEYEYVDIA